MDNIEIILDQVGGRGVDKIGMFIRYIIGYSNNNNNNNTMNNTNDNNNYNNNAI